MYLQMEKQKNLIIRIPESKISRYKELCELNSFTMSKRIRNFINDEINYFEGLKNEKIK